MSKTKNLIVILAVAISIFSLPTYADDLAQWSLRKQIDVYNPFFYSPTNVTMNFTQDTAELIVNGKMKNDCSDIRIVNDKNEIVPYYVQGCNSTDTKIWFMANNLSSEQGQSLSFWMYYNNLNAFDATNSNTTFLWADTENFEVGGNKKWVRNGDNGPATGGPTNIVAKYGNQSMQVMTNGDSSTEIENLSVTSNLGFHDNATIIMYFQRGSGSSFQMIELLTALGNDGIGFGTKNDQSTTRYAIQTFNDGYKDTGINFLDSGGSPTFIKFEANINSTGIFITLNGTQKFNFHKPQTGPG
ncbi:MAG: DUF2341 domain-containing protein, partial [Candidatus Aenigmarchaeota archaeon]|nr:DUF2341 domain-containing protein [Candidatus Aenigmarchaeota archaeon]